jgi:hypothetical protein
MAGPSEGPVVRFDAIRSAGFAAITPAYTAVGPSFPRPMRLIYVTNMTNGDMMFSFTGNTDHFVVPAMGYIIFDFSSNKIDGNDGFFLQKGTQMYIKSLSVPTSGTVYITAVYGS